jgi:hypothetical protein
MMPRSLDTKAANRARIDNTLDPPKNESLSRRHHRLNPGDL